MLIVHTRSRAVVMRDEIAAAAAADNEDKDDG